MDSYILGEHTTKSLTESKQIAISYFLSARIVFEEF